jgi:hypothetical protein
VTDHADTIRQALDWMRLSAVLEADWRAEEALAALDALVSEIDLHGIDDSSRCQGWVTAVLTGSER